MARNRSIIIDQTPLQTRIAILEGSDTVELLFEKPKQQSLIGSIYKARVSRVLPGISSSFIDIGEDKSAFLFVADIFDPELDFRGHDDTDAKKSSIPDQDLRKPIETLLSNEQEIVVQVSKDPINSKGARVTTNITLAGKYMVLMPQSHHVSISRRIEDEQERERLVSIVSSYKPESFGFIVRTAAIDASESDLKKDIDYLIKKWNSIEKRIPHTPAPNKIYDDSNAIERLLRDEDLATISKIVSNHEQLNERIKEILVDYEESENIEVELHNEGRPIFDHFDIEMDIAKATAPKVWLPSGGYLIIEETEALTSIDVNTGKFVGTRSAEDTILKTNAEAIQEVVKQLKLRNIGGIIIVDLIDMKSIADQESIYNDLTELLKNDRARTNVLKISELGLIQMTRKRTKNSISKELLSSCPVCEGIGKTKTLESTATDLINEVKRTLASNENMEFAVQLSETLENYLNQHGKFVKKHIEELAEGKVSFEKGNQSDILKKLHRFELD